MTRNLPRNIKFLTIGLFILAGSCEFAFSQVHISGPINKYGRVTGLGTNYVNVGDNAQFTQFAAGDTVLLIQMKGVRIYADTLSSYGDAGFSYGQAGRHEFLTVQSKDAGNKIIFKNNITVGFDLIGDVQIIKVKSYRYAIIDPAGLTCATWDSTSKTGGVVALIVNRTLVLNGNIDVKGKGFKGGVPSSGLGTCIGIQTKLNKYIYSALTDSSGLKGEGLASLADPLNDGAPPFYPIYPLYAKGKGKNYNGGGGGNGKYSGGGGGSNYGKGGNGGSEVGDCSPTPKPGGLGGVQISGSGIDGGLFLGGGGGGSTNQGGTTTAGGNGGGIVILISDTLKANGKSIIAEGAWPGTASGNSGSGGGGGGGSVALYIKNCINSTGTFLVCANGGKGGDQSNTINPFGEGGGGGGGYILTNTIAYQGTYSLTVTKGLKGDRPGTETATDGSDGRKDLTGFVPLFNGFLFNSIISSVSGTTIDSICSNQIPKKILGTNPVGGSAPYTFHWLKSSSSGGPWTEIASGTTMKDYTFSAPESSTFWIRRYVNDSGILKDTSLAVKIVVQPAITGNLIKKDTTICQGQDPLKLLHSGTPSGGYGNLHYHWLQNTTNNWSSYSSAVGTDSTKADFDPAALSVTTYYKRKINAGHCVDFSNTVTITVLSSITNNTITNADQVICEGSLFTTLSATTPAGAVGPYLWLWQDSASITSGHWNAASGVNNTATHAPDTAKFTLTEERRHFRRIVYSADTYHVCKNISAPVLLTRYHKIKNNIIAAPQTICEGFAPVPLTGFLPAQGDGTYTYIWQQSSDGSTWPGNAAGTYTTKDYTAPVLTSSTWYRRTVNSSVCTNTSNVIKVTVQPRITNNVINLRSGWTDSTICSGAKPKRIIGKTAPILAGGDGTTYYFKWKSSADGSDYSNIPGATLSYFDETATLPATKYYKRVVSSGVCKDSANSVKINVLPSLVNSIPSVRTVCISTPSDPVMSLSLSGGRTNQYNFLWESSTDGTTWTKMTADTVRSSSGANLTLPLLTVPTKYRRKVWSGPFNTCFSASNILDVAVDQKPYPVFAGNDTLLNSFEYVFRLEALAPVLGSGVWRQKSGSGTLVFDDSTQYNTYVRDLSPEGSNVILWHVRNGMCVIDTTVSIEIVNIDVPQGISPGNNDNLNDELIIDGIDMSVDPGTGLPSQIVDLTILNSAGAEVFHTTNDGGNEWKNWDGKDSGGIDLPEGTYYYLLKIKSNRIDDQIKKKGFIILKRH